MASEKTPVVWDDDAKKHRPLGSGEKMGGLSASSMISTDSGNLLQQGSDGLMLVTGSSLADPRADNLLEESGSGKLQVTSDRVVEWLEGHPQAAAAIADAVKVVSGDDGNVIVQGTDKGAFLPKQAISSAVSGMSAAQLATLANALRKAGGGLSVGSDGKLSVDFASMDPAIMRAVVLSMVQQGGGIAVDSSGKLYVDFDNMPTDKFEALLKSLRMQVPLNANMNLYVDTATGSDTIVDGRGTEAKPFKTIRACINWFTQNYAVGPYMVYVNVKPGTYTENVVLPVYNRTTGRIRVQAFDFANPPILQNPGVNSQIVSCTGRGWDLVRLKLNATRQASSDGVNHFVVDLGVSGGDAGVTIYGCSFLTSYIGSAPASGTTHLRTVSLTDGATLNFGTMNAYGNTFEVHKGNATSLAVFFVSEGTAIGYGSDSAEAVVDIYGSGEFTRFASVSNRSMMMLVQDRTYNQRFVVPSGSTAVGQRFYVSLSSSLILNSSNSLPGDVEGEVVTASYGYYQGGHLQ